MTARRRLTVFYDGACSLCRRQVAFWQWLDRHRRVDWQDISRDARALLGTGISHRRALHRVHAFTSAGQKLQGARVVAALMQEMPRLRLLGRLASLPPFVWLLELLYLVASPLRHLFTGRWKNCCGEE